MNKLLQGKKKLLVGGVTILVGILVMLGYIGIEGAQSSVSVIAGAAMTILGSLGYLFAEAKVDAARFNTKK